MSGKTYRWTPANVERAARELGNHDSLRAALPAISRIVGFTVTRAGMDCAFARQGHGTAASYLRPNRNVAGRERRPTAHEPSKGLNIRESRIAEPEIPIEWDEEEDTSPGFTPPAPPASEPVHDEFASLVALAKKHAKRGGLTLETLCDEMRLTPRDGRALAERAIEAGYHVDVHAGVLDFRPPEPQPHKEVAIEAPSAELGEEIVIGVVSDPHFASKHHERDALRRHMEWLYESGVRTVFGPGDWVAGGYPFLKYEVTSNGIEDQSEEAVAFIQEMGPEFSWQTIAGNHCESHKAGIDAAKMIEQMLLARGWTNFRYHGPRGALLRFGHTRIGLHHPGGGLAYALSYKIQKYIDAMPLHDRPHFVFTGHTHQKLWIERGGVNGFLCGTFENGDSGFGRMLGGEVQVGGWLIRYRHDEHGNVASVNAEFRHQPHRRMNYIQVPA